MGSAQPKPAAEPEPAAPEQPPVIEDTVPAQAQQPRAVTPTAPVLASRLRYNASELAGALGLSPAEVKVLLSTYQYLSLAAAALQMQRQGSPPTPDACRAALAATQDGDGVFVTQPAVALALQFLEQEGGSGAGAAQEGALQAAAALQALPDLDAPPGGERRALTFSAFATLYSQFKADPAAAAARALLQRGHDAPAVQRTVLQLAEDEDISGAGRALPSAEEVSAALARVGTDAGGVEAADVLELLGQDASVDAGALLTGALTSDDPLAALLDAEG